jgi:hypothetical protein
MGSPLTRNCWREPSSLVRLKLKSRKGCRASILACSSRRCVSSHPPVEALDETPIAQFGGAFPHRLLQHGVELLELPVQQTHLDHVVDAGFYLHEIEGLADEVLGTGLQRAQLVARLRREHDDRQVIVRLVGLEAFHHLKSVHARHLQVEQNQVIAVLAVQGADFERFPRRCYVAVPGLFEHAGEQQYIRALIIHDQNTRSENVSVIDHWVPRSTAPPD